ncbi:MAG: type II toxin-antitoxin system VapC family toxin [Alkalispirochaeta sp.]
MILLDTNYLIRLLVDETEEAERVDEWVRTGEDLITSSIVWYEFLSGPVDGEGIAIVETLLDGRVVPFAGAHATEAARLYNAGGRFRRLRIAAMIAATAIVTGAGLATENAEDFRTFTRFGLKLV